MDQPRRRRTRSRSERLLLHFQARSKGAAVNKLSVLAFLVVATSLEASGDAIVRLGLNHEGYAGRAYLFLAGAVLLFG